MSLKSLACAALAVCLVFGAVGCGSQSFSGGFGTLAITSVAPNPVPGMTPTNVTITGGDFSNQVGTIVEVEWRASSGTPFLGGTSQTATTQGTITSATTIDTVTPRVVICGPSSITAFVKVTMPSGVFGMSVAAIMTFTAPTITSFAGGGIFPAAIPTPFVLNGTGFGDIGSPVTIHWSSASPLFEAGSSTTTTTDGVVTGATTIAGTSPLALVCGPASLGATVTRVSFQDGSCTPTGTAVPATFVAPTITAVVNTGGGLDNGTNGFAAAIPESFTVTGTGYGPVGGSATINITSTGVAIFTNGTSTTTAVSGTIQSATTISVPASALAEMCSPGFTTQTVTFGVLLPDGSCTPSTVNGTYNAPQITSIQNAEPGGALNGTNDFDAARSVEFIITGTRLGVTGDAAHVTFVAPSAIFDGGVDNGIVVVASVASATTITGESPEALVCGVASVSAAVNAIVNGGSCAPATVTADFLAPTFTSIVNTAAGSPWNGTNQFAAAVPESFSITGTGFGPVGGVATITWFNNAANFPTPYLGGTTNTITVPGQIVSNTQIVGISPEGGFCSILGTVIAGQILTVTMPDGSCTLSTPGGAAIMRPPTVTAIANLDRGGSAFLSAIPETFQVTGTDFGPVGGTAAVRWRSYSVGTAATPFPGPSAETTVLATITSRTTLEGISPQALLCPVPGVDPATGLNADIEILATLEGGACNSTNPAALDFGTDFPTLLQGPTLVAADLLVATPPAQGLAGGPALDVPTTVVVGEDEMADFRITGTGFAPLGAIAMVTFEDIGNGAGVADLNGGTTLMVPAFVVSETVIEGQLPAVTMPRMTQSENVRVTVALAPNGSCAFDDALFNFVAPPTVTSVINNEVGGTGFFNAGFGAGDMFAGMSSRTTINGTGFQNNLVDYFVYSTTHGLDPNTDIPVRRMGTGNPVSGFMEDYDFDLAGGGGGIAHGPTVTNGGILRYEALGPDLDTDGDGLVPYTLRAQNPDGQYHDFAAGNYRLTSAAANLGTSANIRNNNSIAVNPISFTDDFLRPGADPTDPTGTTGQQVVAVSNDEAPGGGLGLFNGTDILVGRTVDGGATWITGPMGAAAADGLAPGAARSYAKVVSDRFGNFWVAYVVDDYAGINFDASIMVLWSQDSGATWSQPPGAFFPNGGLFSAGLWNSPDIAVGPWWFDTTQDEILVAWVNGLTFPNDIGLYGWSTNALGSWTAAFFSLAPGIVDAPGPAFGLQSVEIAIGNAGERYVSWQEPQFGGPPPFTTNFMFDYTLAGGAWQVDQLAFSDFIPFFALPAYADIQFFEPVMDLAVAKAGANAGRILWVYDHIYPNGGGNPVDHAGVLARFSDAPGAAWSGAVGTHPVDTADRFIPAVCSDPVSGRFYLTWYDTTSSIGAGNTTFERYGSASADGVNWSLVRNLSGLRGASAHVVDFDTDFGAFAGVAAYNGCVYATWSDTVDSGTNADAVVVGYQQK